MPKPSWSGDVSRKIVRHIVVEADLVLQTPAHFGSGDGDELVDMPLLVDPRDEKTPLLTGASIAGALRGYLHEHEYGFRAKVNKRANARTSPIVLLFGGNSGYEYGEQSPLIVEDARGKNFILGKDAAIELRDGVGLAGKSHTADHDKLFNIEMWEAGTTFPLRFELIVRQQDNPLALKRALATALAGFNNGSITIGARKRRGYGQVSVTGWRIEEYDLTKTAQLLDWIANGANELSSPANPDIVQATGVGKKRDDHRKAFCLKAEFSLDGSLLIRSGSGPDIEPGTLQTPADDPNIQRPDFIHLHSARPTPQGTRKQPILSGTSLSGALRARALKIARLIALSAEEGEQKACDLIDSMFGANLKNVPVEAEMENVPEPKASRITVYEHEVSGVAEKEHTSVQNRVSIDRFTGGTRDGALFNEQPLFGGEESVVIVDLQLANPQEYEIGLLLLLLKDLWTGDLPLGGEISVGRGRLRGKSCHLEYRNGQVLAWNLFANGDNGLRVEGDKPQDLENYVAKLHTHLGGSES